MTILGYKKSHPVGEDSERRCLFVYMSMFITCQCLLLFVMIDASLVLDLSVALSGHSREHFLAVPLIHQQTEFVHIIN